TLTLLNGNFSLLKETICMTRYLANAILLAAVALQANLAIAQPYFDDSYRSYSEECCYEGVPPNMTHPNKLSLAPEYYHIQRTRNGGTKQSGNAGGLRLTYDYLKRYCVYVG